MENGKPVEVHLLEDVDIPYWLATCDQAKVLIDAKSNTEREGAPL